MHIKLERLLAASPDKVWALVSDPDQMNQWSEAQIQLTALGADDSASAVGTARTVKLGRVLLRETIVRSEPPHHLVYRVAASYPLRKHEGVITLTADGAQTTLQWEINATLVHPVLEPLVKRVLSRALERSLDKLKELCALDSRSLASRVAGAAPIKDNLEALWADAMAVLEEQRQLAHRLSTQDSPLQWFSRAYAHVTDLQMREVKAGSFEHPGWVLRLIPSFHHYYVENLRAFTHESRAPVESHWQRAFVRMHKRAGRPIDRALAAVAVGAVAHIDEDLPRSLAAVHHQHYAAHRFGRFRGDYMTMGPIFREAGSRLIAELPASWFGLRDRILASALSPELREQVEARIFYNIPRARLRAFERAERLSSLLGAHHQLGDQPREVGRVS